MVLGYKQLHEIERVNRDLKHTVDVRPDLNHRSDRIEVPVLLCWLALLLTRIAEIETDGSWYQLKKIFRPLLVANHATPHGVISQTNKLTPGQKRVLEGLNRKALKCYLAIPTPEKA